MIAIGATDGNIIAVIIATQSARNAGRASPIVPGPMPMPDAWRTVTNQARTASAVNATHAGTSCLAGRPRVGALRPPSACAAVCVTPASRADVLVRLAAVLEVGRLAIGRRGRVTERVQASTR